MYEYGCVYTKGLRGLKRFKHKTWADHGKRVRERPPHVVVHLASLRRTVLQGREVAEQIHVYDEFFGASHRDE